MRNVLIILNLFVCSYFFSQVPNSWIKKNDFAGFKREQAVAITVLDKAYIGTGVDTAEMVMNDWWEYNASSDIWTQKANVPGPARTCAIGFGLNNKGYVGTGVDNNEAQMGNKLFDLHEYNPATNTWLPKANFPGAGGFGVYYSTAFVVDNKGYVCGGKIGPSSYTQEMWEYKPSIDNWTARANFPGGPRYNMSSVGVGVNAFVGLGTNFDTYMNDWWKYEVGTNSWEQQTNFPGGYRGGACAFSVVGKAFVACGTNGGPKADTYEFNPISGNWSPRSDYGGSERKQAVCFVIGNRAFLGTGSGTGGKKNSMYEYVSLYTAGIEEIENQIAVYPTISTETIHIDLPLEYSYSTISIVNEMGQVVSNQTITNHAFEMARNELPAGNYFLEFNSNDGMPKLQRRIIFVD